MARGGIGEPHLLACGKGAKSGGERERERAVIESRRERGGETTSEGEPAHHPARLVTEELSDRQGREAVLVDERSDDTHLVHRARGLLGRVGLEQSRLSGQARDRLDHDGDLSPAFGSVALESLETVEDLEGVVVVGRDAKGHRGEIGWRVGVWAAKTRQRGAKPLDRHDEDSAHVVSSSTGRI